MKIFNKIEYMKNNKIIISHKFRLNQEEWKKSQRNI